MGSSGGLVAMIVDEDTATGMLLAGIGQTDIKKNTNFLIVNDKTAASDIEGAFAEFTNREDVSVLLVTQSIASGIRHLIDSYNKPVPAVLEIPTKDQPYDPSQDSILSRVKFMFGEG
mmetsp:Transcript_12686/g.25475  ORF Transcript_12686/g.25475 Transcript_12686/m.25475 type:complete len:117 (+) Transcript_12686:75-425(+)